VKQDMKAHILATGADLVHRQGYNHTGIQEILKASGVPKGSFYFYFENKEAFGLSLVDHFNDHWAGVVGPALQDKSVSAVSRLRNFFAFFHGFFEQEGFTRGCPIGNLAQELGDLSPAFAEKLSEAIDMMARSLIPVLREGVEAGEIQSELDIEETAYFIIAAWHGALLRMKANKSRDSLDLFERMIFETLLV
jgi:TetR/AcrR family transcriptional regulator, transcriptional repressor for nem operon